VLAITTMRNSSMLISMVFQRQAGTTTTAENFGFPTTITPQLGRSIRSPWS
jgi:hypothetical protein